MPEIDKKRGRVKQQVQYYEMAESNSKCNIRKLI